MRHGNGLNAIWQDKCTQQSYGAFNLPLVAFSLSGDLNKNRTCCRVQRDFHAANYSLLDVAIQSVQLDNCPVRLNASAPYDGNYFQKQKIVAIEPIDKYSKI